ncbi:hypothetical protein Bca4012_065843 [Brassica carinata]
MFHTAQWTESHAPSNPTLSSIKIWAHLMGVPLDLRHQQGLSLVAGLIGDPKETDDFTLNLVSLTLSHVKVEVDLTKPLPRVVEFSRQSGQIVEVQVDFPCLPATCSHCHELGHVVRNCLKLPPAPAPPANGNNKKGKSSVTSAKTQPANSQTMQFVAKKTLPPGSTATPVNHPSSNSSHPLPVPSSHKTPLPKQPRPPKASFLSPLSVNKTPLPEPPVIHSLPHSPSDKPKKPSLKRSRSSPSLSPPQNSFTSHKSLLPNPVSPFLHEGLGVFLSGSPNFNPATHNPFSVLTTGSSSLQPLGDPPNSS